MRNEARFIAISSITLGVVLFSGLARAQDSTAAQALFEEGRRLMNDGKFGDACPKLAASQKLDPGAGTLLNLATCYEKNGQLASAWSTFKEAAAAARQSGHPDWETGARERASKIEPNLSRLTIVVPPEANVPGLVIERDGRRVDNAEWGIALPIDPGVHPVEALAPKKQKWSTTVTVGPNGAAASVTIPALSVEQSDAPAGAAPAPMGTAPPPADRPAEDSGAGQRTAGLVVGGVGVVGLAVGSIFGLMAKSTHDDALKHCVGNICSQQGLDLDDSARGKAAVATVGIVAGAALLVGGAVLFLTAPHAPKAEAAPPVARVWVGPAAVGGVW